MSTMPIGIVVEGGNVIGVVNCETPIHVIDLDAKEIWPISPFSEWTEDEYRDYVNITLQDLTGNSPYQNQPAEQT